MSESRVVGRLLKSEPMFELLAPRGICDGESDLLQCHSSVIIRTQYVDARLLQSAEQAPLAGRFVVALPVVFAVPHRLVFEEFMRLQENAQVVIRDRLVPSLEFGVRWRLLRSLLRGFNRTDIGRPARDKDDD